MNRLTVYIKGYPKPIIISEANEENLNNLIDGAESIFRSDNIFKINTTTDCLIGRPREIQAILISTDKKVNESNDKPEEINDSTYK